MDHTQIKNLDKLDSKGRAGLLAALMQDTYLSTACAAGKCRECRQIDKYRALVCVCQTCAHVDLSHTPTPPCGPLLHAARNRRHRKADYTYPGTEELGVRNDVMAAQLRVVRMTSALIPHTLHEELAWRHAVAACLVFAPRRL